MTKRLVSDETHGAYLDRFQNMMVHKFSEEGDKLFMAKMVAVSEQVDNMYVKATINDAIEVHNDGPKELGGSGKAPSPMISLLGSLANCLEITALLYFSFKKIEVNSVKIKIEANLDRRSALEPNKEPFPGFYDLSYTWYVDSPARKRRIENILNTVVKICPVGGTLLRSHDPSQEVIIKQ